jgi:hypothetical protein
MTARGRYGLVTLVTGVLFVAATIGVGTASPAQSNGLLVSISSDRANPRALGNARLTGNAYIFLRSKVADVRRVSYYVDDPLRQKRPLRVTSRSPFDLRGQSPSGKAYPFSIDKLDGGRHVVTAIVELKNGKERIVKASFTALRCYLAPTGDDAGACSVARPCKTLARAIAASRDGAVIEAADGFYGCETLSGAAHVTIRAARNARPWIACGTTLDNGGASLHLDNVSGLTIEGLWISGVEFNGGSQITFRNVHVTCRDTEPFQLWDGHCSAKLEGGPSGFAMIGGEVGPTWDNETGGAPGASRLFGDKLLLDGVTFNENKRGPGAHSECLMIRGGNGVTIRNSRFPLCNIFSIYFTYWDWTGTPAPRNVLLENNYFGPGPEFYSIMIADFIQTADTFRLRYNTISKRVSWDAPAVNSEMIGNIFPFENCPTGVKFAFNVILDAESNKCSSSDRSTKGPDFTISGIGVDASGHLTRSSSAIGRGDPKDFPPRDIDGEKRPVGRGPDAGSDEFG